METFLSAVTKAIFAVRKWLRNLCFTIGIGSLLLIFFTSPIYAASWEWDDGGSTDSWSDKNQPKYYQNWNPDSNPTIVGGVTPEITFGNLVTSNQLITVQDGDKTVHKLFFTSNYEYTLEAKGSTTLIFDSGSVGGDALIDVSSPASQTLNIAISTNTNLVFNQSPSSTFTFLDTIGINSYDFTVNTEGTVNIESDITGTGNVIKQGSGILYLKAKSTGYSGTTTISDGILRVQNDNALGTGNVVVESGGTLSLEDPSKIKLPNNLYLSGSGYNNLGALQSFLGDNNIEGSITLNDNATIRTESGSTLTIEQGISGANKDLTFAGPGTTTLLATSTYSGKTIVDEGTLILDITNTLSQTNEVILQSGGTLIFNEDQGINSAANLTLAGGTLITQGTNQTLQTLTLSSNSTLDISGGDSQLEFSDLTYANNAVLTIAGYTETDSIIISTVVSQDFLDNVYWQDLDIYGAAQLSDGRIVPLVVPEASTYFVGITGLLLASWQYLRKKTKTLFLKNNKTST